MKFKINNKLQYVQTKKKYLKWLRQSIGNYLGKPKKIKWRARGKNKNEKIKQLNCFVYS